MQLAADAEAAFELCQRLHSCPICACKCVRWGGWACMPGQAPSRGQPAGCFHACFSLPQLSGEHMHAGVLAPCRCPGAGKWVEGDEESRGAFRGGRGRPCWVRQRTWILP